MSPRVKRRLSYLAAAAVVLALLAAGATLMTGSHHSAPRFSPVQSTPASIRYLANRAKLVYGMTPRQVRRVVGPPRSVAGNCWRYPPYSYVGPQKKVFVTADALCFYYGHYSTQEFMKDGRWDVMTSHGAAPA